MQSLMPYLSMPRGVLTNYITTHEVTQTKITISPTKYSPNKLQVLSDARNHKINCLSTKYGKAMKEIFMTQFNDEC